MAYIGPAGSGGGSLAPVPSSLVSFDLNGTTRASGTAADGSGQFYALNVTVTAMPLGNADIQIRAWYAGELYATYDMASASGMNIGKSAVMTINLKAATDPTILSLTDIGMPPFIVSLLEVCPPGPINITGIQVTNGTAAISFHDASDWSWRFDVLASTNVTGPYLPVSAVITYQGGIFDYQATLSTTNQTQFYRIKRW